RLVSDWSSDVCSSDLRHGHTQPCLQRDWSCASNSRCARGNGNYKSRKEITQVRKSLKLLVSTIVLLTGLFAGHGSAYGQDANLRSEERRVGKERCARW